MAYKFCLLRKAFRSCFPGLTSDKQTGHWVFWISAPTKVILNSQQGQLVTWKCYCWSFSLPSVSPDADFVASQIFSFRNMYDLKKSWAYLQLHAPPFPQSCLYPDSVTTISVPSFQSQITATQGQAEVWSQSVSELLSLFVEKREIENYLYSGFLLLPCRKSSHPNPFQRFWKVFGSPKGK